VTDDTKEVLKAMLEHDRACAICRPEGKMAIFNLHEFVETWFDTGCGRHMGGPQLLYGQVVQSGPKAALIVWESGLTNRVRHHAGGIKHARDLEEAYKAMVKAEKKVLEYFR
jgi:hypothetical protein